MRSKADVTPAQVKLDFFGRRFFDVVVFRTIFLEQPNGDVPRKAYIEGQSMMAGNDGKNGPKPAQFPPQKQHPQTHLCTITNALNYHP